MKPHCSDYEHAEGSVNRASMAWQARPSNSHGQCVSSPSARMSLTGFPSLLLLRALRVLAVLAAARAGNAKIPGIHLPGVHLLHTSRLVVEIPEVKECEVRPVPDNAIHFSSVRMGMVGKVDYVIDAEFNVSRSATSLKEVQVELTKCREAVSSNTCEYFQTWRFKDHLCKDWNDPSKPWGPTLSHIQPRPDCPIKQGAYSIRNGTLDLQVLQALPIQLEGSIWLVRAVFKEDSGTAFACIEITMEPHRVRD